MEKTHESVIKLWQSYLKENKLADNTTRPPHYYFCNNKKDADECAELVVQGHKRATAGCLWDYERLNEALPKVGDQFIITNWEGIAKGLVETTKVETIPFNQITEEHAYMEGEGDKSLAYWRKVHIEFFEKEFENTNLKVSEDMPIVFETFKVIYS